MGKIIENCTKHEPILAASRDEISALQLKKLKWSVRHAYDNVPMYKQKYDKAGVHPDDLVHLDDLAKFPFTTKEDLRQSYPFNMFAVPMKDVVRIHASSGTTGKPTVVGYTKDDIVTWANLVARSIRASGGLPEHKIHIAYGYGLFTGGLGAHYGAEALGCTVIPMSGGQTEKQIQMILDFQPEIVMVTPSYMLALADGFTARGIDPRSTSLKNRYIWRGALERGKCAQRSKPNSLLTRLIFTGFQNLWARVWPMNARETKDGGAYLGRCVFARNYRPKYICPACRRHVRRVCSHRTV